MMERIKRFFRKGNLIYMLIALAMAFLIWLAVTKPFLFQF
jgi:hypothetical protein